MPNGSFLSSKPCISPKFEKSKEICKVLSLNTIILIHTYTLLYCSFFGTEYLIKKTALLYLIEFVFYYGNKKNEEKYKVKTEKIFQLFIFKIFETSVAFCLLSAMRDPN